MLEVFYFKPLTLGLPGQGGDMGALASRGRDKTMCHQATAVSNEFRLFWPTSKVINIIKICVATREKKRNETETKY